MSITITFPTTSLASRSKAAETRACVMTALKANQDKVVLDFSSVDSVSASYADELFGVLSQIFGVDELTQRVQISQASQDTIVVIAKAIYERELSNTHFNKPTGALAAHAFC